MARISLRHCSFCRKVSMVFARSFGIALVVANFVQKTVGSCYTKPMLIRIAFLILVAFGGAALTLQAAWNARLRVATASPVLTTIISITVTLVTLVTLWATGLTNRGSVPAFGSIPKWAWLGGICAAYYLIASLVALPKLGAASVFSLVIAGQVLTAVALDSVGAFGVPQISLSMTKIVGAILLLVGVVLIQKA
jgi:transporter family-2 protein